MINKILTVLTIVVSQAHTLSLRLGSIKSETYQAEFEKKKSIDDVSDYGGPMIPII